jgi:thiazole synthase
LTSFYKKDKVLDSNFSEGFFVKDMFYLGGSVFHSRLIVGTGKFDSLATLQKVIQISKTQMVTVALRRVDLDNPKDNLLLAIDRFQVTLLPNTSGAQNAEEAIRLARLAKASGISDWIKLEIIPDPKYLLPDGEETLKAARVLVQEGFKVMPYIQADPILAKKLEECGVVSVMPLGSPIGSNQGIKTLEMLKIIIAESQVPVIVDAGIGTPSQASFAMELGASAVLINTAIATAGDPVLMADAFRQSVEAGRSAYFAGMPIAQTMASPSSTLAWISP